MPITISTRLATFLATYPWRSAALVAFVVVTFALNVVWIWGFFWIWWAVSSARTGQFVFLDIVTRREHPYLFWTMVLCWSLVGVSYFLNEFYPTYLEY